MKIRRAFAEDAKDVRTIHHCAYQISYRGYLPESYLNNMSLSKDLIAQSRQNINTYEYYVAEKAGKILGFARVDYPRKGTFELKGLYIHPDFQKQGIGSALITEICRLKKGLGYQKLVLWTLKKGPSLEFYKKHGLKKSRVPEKLYRFGTFDIPAIRLEKKL